MYVLALKRHIVVRVFCCVTFWLVALHSTWNSDINRPFPSWLVALHSTWNSDINRPFPSWLVALHSTWNSDINRPFPSYLACASVLK